MSSPFRYFRKHTKVFLAVAAVLAIFIFVVGDALNTAGGAGGDDRSGTATVATWNGGSLNEAQLGSLVAQRMLVNDFLMRVFVQGGGTSDYDLPSSVPPLLLNSKQVEAIETDVIGTEVMANLATQAGMTVSDALINHYIEEMGLKNVSGEQIVGILKSIGQHKAQANEAIVFNMLRKMLLAHFYHRTYQDASMVVLPQQRWDDWRSVNERISVEAAILPVEKFLAEVPEPTDAQLMAFYNDYKEADPGRFQNVGGRELPISDPGFAVPRRVTLQYLLGNLNARTEKLMPSVTEEEIKDYYERNKRRDFTKLGLPGDEAFGAPAAGTPAPETPAGEDPAKTQEEVDRETAATTSEAAETPAEPATEPAAPAAEPVAEPAGKPAAGAPAGEETESSSSIRKSSPFRLAAFQTAPAEVEDAAEPASDAAAESEASEPAEEPAPAAETPAAETPAAETPAAKATAAETSEAKTTVDAGAASKEEAVEFEPLDKVREDIRKAIAMDKAVQELETVMGEAGAQLQAEYNRYGSLVAAAKEKDAKSPKLPKAPAKLTDLKWLADQYGLTYEKTTPLTIRELSETAVGRAIDTASQRMNVTGFVIQSRDLYEPLLAEDLEGNRYLVMTTENSPRRFPEFKEVRDQVVQAWKRAQAAKLAEKKAKELAAEVAESGTPFDQFFFADRGFEVIKPTAFFSWRNYPVGRAGRGAPPGLSDVPELKNVGPEFMDAAFDLDEKEVVGLLNFDRSAAYVLRLDRRQYTDDELKKLFLEEEGSWPGRFDMMREHYSMFNSAVESEILKDRAGLEFDEDWLKRRAERMQERQN